MEKILIEYVCLSLEFIDEYFDLECPNNEDLEIF